MLVSNRQTIHPHHLSPEVGIGVEEEAADVVVVVVAAAAVTSSDPGGEKEQQKPNVECCTHVLFPNKTANFSTDG